MTGLIEGFFDEDFRLEKISKQGDPLRKLDEYIDWEMFRPILKKAFRKKAKGPGGRPPFDYVMMFKILMLQRLYNLSDAQMQFHILDRLSFMRFLGLQVNDTFPTRNGSTISVISVLMHRNLYFYTYRFPLQDKVFFLFLTYRFITGVCMSMDMSRSVSTGTLFFIMAFDSLFYISCFVQCTL